jgi:hypothetical protein
MGAGMVVVTSPNLRMIVFVEKVFLSISVLAVVWAIFRFTERRFERCRHQNHIAYAREKTAVHHDDIRELIAGVIDSPDMAA